MQAYVVQQLSTSPEGPNLGAAVRASCAAACCPPETLCVGSLWRFVPCSFACCARCADASSVSIVQHPTQVTNLLINMVIRLHAVRLLLIVFFADFSRRSPTC